MTTEILLQIILSSLTHLSELSALFSKAQAEGRDLTPEEVAFVRGKAVSANDALGAAISAAPLGGGGPGEE
jgi:hypothetical protein